jgi:hypothetical protein
MVKTRKPIDRAMRLTRAAIDIGAVTRRHDCRLAYRLMINQVTKRLVQAGALKGNLLPNV